MGYTPGSTIGFFIFFLLLALSRLFSKSLEDSIESPSFKVIYQTVDEKIRYDVQSGINVTVNEIAALLSGLLLTGLGVLSFIKLIHFSWVLFTISLMWIFVAFRLYSEYRKSIRKALEKVIHTGPEAVNLNEQVIFNSRFGARWEFRTDYFSLISGDYSKFENNRNKWYFEKLIDHSGSKEDINLIPVLKKIALNPGVDKGIRQHSSETIKILEELQSSDKYEDAKIGKARKMLSGTRQPQTIEILRLLRETWDFHDWKIQII
jgi:hypothetical protein